MVKHINDKDFNIEVLDENGVVVVDFWANWCGPCKMIAPVIDELADEMKNVKFVKVDVDKNPTIAGKFQVASIPTLMMFKDGKPVDTVVGFRPKAALEESIKKHI
ncbi:MAG: thioredoxin [Sarcina sp.]